MNHEKDAREINIGPKKRGEQLKFLARFNCFDLPFQLFYKHFLSVIQILMNAIIMMINHYKKYHKESISTREVKPTTIRQQQIIFIILNTIHISIFCIITYLFCIVPIDSVTKRMFTIQWLTKSTTHINVLSQFLCFLHFVSPLSIMALYLQMLVLYPTLSYSGRCSQGINRQAFLVTPWSTRVLCDYLSTW